jgi:Lon protease-like protein
VTVRLPLFPLGTVLFPGLVLPLHIFEERYRTLVRDLIDLPEGAPRRFGVVAIKAGREVGTDSVAALYDVGCTAELNKVEAYEDGRFDIVTHGGTRFRLLEVDRSGPYVQGDVELLGEESGDRAEWLRAEVVRPFTEYQSRLRGLQGEPEGEPPGLPTDPVVLSYLVAAASILDLTDKQRLLGAPDAATRLRLERSLLRRENAIIDPLPSLPAVDLLRQGVTLN